MNKDFFDKNEKNGFKYLKAFNDVVHLFPEVIKTPEKHPYDASATTKGDKTFNIEIKIRNQILLDDLRVSGHSNSGKEYIENTLMIESHKMASQLLYASFYGYTPLYVNFLLDGTVIIFNLHNLKTFPERKDKVKTYSKGYQRKEEEMKYYLDISDACIYKNNVLIKRCNE